MVVDVASPLEYRCRRADRCANRVPVQGVSGEFVGASLMAVDGLCALCDAQALDAVRKLTLDWVELNTLLPADGSSSGEAPVSGSREAPIPIRPSVEALQALIVRETTWWAEAVAAELGVDCPPLPRAPGRRVQAATDVLIATWTNLLDLPEQLHGFTDDDNTNWHWLERDGIDAALVLLDLHERTAVMAGRTERIERLPAPCPECDKLSLVRRNGHENVECRNPACPVILRPAEYASLVNVLVIDLGVAA